MRLIIFLMFGLIVGPCLLLIAWQHSPNQANILWLCIGYGIYQLAIGVYWIVRR